MNARRHAWPFLAICTGAFLLRLLYLFEIQDLALFHRLAFDGARYDAWAQEIAAGDWIGDDVFFQAPLYPYFLAVVQTVFGHDLWAMRVVQAALGALGCGLVYLAGTSFLSRRAGIAAGTLMALYAPAIFFDGLIQKATLDFFLISLLLAFCGAAYRQPRRGALWLASGLTLAFLCLTRENALLWVPLVPLWIWFFTGKERAVRLRGVACFGAGLGAVLLSVGLRNYLVGDQFALTTSQFGANLYIGNSKDADGTYTPFNAGWGNPELEQEDIRRLAERDVGRPLTPAEISDYWLQRTLTDIRADVGKWLLLMLKKSFLVWNQRELEDADDFYLYRDHSLVLRVLSPASPFALLLALAAMGLVWARERWRPLALPVAFALSMAAGIALFFVFARYRFALVPPLALLAGGALGGARQLVRPDERRKVLASAVAGVAALAIAYLPLIDRPAPSPAGYNNLANALIEEGRLEEARQAFERALELSPGSGALHYNAGNLLVCMGRAAEAEAALLAAIRLEPELAEAYNNLGALYASQRKTREAIRLFREALEREPDLVDAHRNLARQLAFGGDLPGAEEHLRHALSVRPDLPALHNELSSVLKQLGRDDEAQRHREEALRLKALRREQGGT